MSSRPLMFPLMFLAQSEKQVGQAIFWLIVIVVALIALFGAVMLYRKWMNADDSTSSAGFTLSDLRRLHKEGKMTSEEFEKAKTALIGSVKAAADKPTSDNPPAGPRINPPGLN